MTREPRDFQPTKETRPMSIINLLVRILERRAPSEAGMTTAELLGNAALGVLALVVIWGMLQALGVDIVNWIRGQLL
jgi:hypothetical protein